LARSDISPEQAHGRVADARSDIFSLGVVLHEMIAGQRPFQGESAAALLASVLSHDPPLLRTVVPSTPRSIERCVARCLQKDPDRRYQNAADLQAALEDIREDLAAPPTMPPGDEAVAAPLHRSRAVRRLTYTVCATAIAAAAFLVGRSLRPSIVPTPDYRPFITEAQTVGVPVWSPDGRSIAYIAEGGGQRQVFLRGLDATESTQVTRQGADGISLFWSPDGARIYFTRAGDGSLMTVGVGGGTLSALTGGKDDEVSPSVTPDGRRIAFVSRRSGLDLIRVRLDSRLPEPLLATSRTESRPDMSASGLLAYVTDAGGRREVRVRTDINAWSRSVRGNSGPGQDEGMPFAVRVSPDDQRVAVEAYGAEHLIWIYPIAGGPPVRLDLETTDQHGPSWSPDGNWIAYRRLRNGTWELVKAPVGGGAVRRLDDADPGGAPTDWSRTGEWIAHGRPDGMHLVSADGTATRVLAGLRSGAFHFSRDGSRLMAVTRGANRQWELTIWELAAARQMRVVALPLPSTADVQGMALSPDDSYIVLAAGTPTSDIWLLEQFEPLSAPLARWLRR
jgi:Tol biopolymer transport system component